jgi:hypothetical protein
MRLGEEWGAEGEIQGQRGPVDFKGGTAKWAVGLEGTTRWKGVGVVLVGKLVGSHSIISRDPRIDERGLHRGQVAY